MAQLRLGSRIVWGSDALKTLEEWADRRVLVVSDGFLAKNGLLERVLAALKESTVSVFDGVDGEPTLEMVARGIAAFRKLDAQAVLAFGGGSAMDCAKGIVWCAEEPVPLWCIPTTAGTGSEVTAFSVLTDRATGVKFPLVSPALVPQVALLDGQFLEGVPQAVTADTGLDVLTHAAEAYVATRSSLFTDALAEKSFAVAYARLPAAFAGDLEAKGEMLFASMLAGLAFDAAGLGACHAMAHALGARLHAPHGRVNALLLPRVIEANAQAPEAARKYAQLAKACGLSPGARPLAGAIRRLGRRLGLPEALEGQPDLAAVAADAGRDPCMADNPRPIPQKELEAMLREVVR